MIIDKPKRAFILAAGMGTRLRPYTDHCPKPMVQVAGRSLIARSLDKLVAAGVDEVVINLHYLADVLRAHVEDTVRGIEDAGKTLRVHFSFEDVLLDTGGGVRKALDYFEDDPFYVIAGDALWEDQAGEVSALDWLAQAWDPAQMDIVTLMEPLSRMVLTRGVGDYDLLDDGQAVRCADKSGAYMWTNIRLNSPVIYRDRPVGGAFSFLPLMDEAQGLGRLRALVHGGAWHHISTPSDLEAVDAYFRCQEEVPVL